VEGKEREKSERCRDGRERSGRRKVMEKEEEKKGNGEVRGSREKGEDLLHWLWGWTPLAMGPGCGKLLTLQGTVLYQAIDHVARSLSPAICCRHLRRRLSRAEARKGKRVGRNWQECFPMEECHISDRRNKETQRTSKSE